MDLRTIHEYTPEPRFADTLEFQPEPAFFAGLPVEMLANPAYLQPFDLADILTTEAQDQRETESLEAFLDRMRMEGRA